MCYPTIFLFVPVYHKARRSFLTVRPDQVNGNRRLRVRVRIKRGLKLLCTRKYDLEECPCILLFHIIELLRKIIVLPDGPIILFPLGRVIKIDLDRFQVFIERTKGSLVRQELISGWEREYIIPADVLDEWKINS